MATSFANPQASAMSPLDGSSSPTPGNQLTDTLGKLIMILRQLALQNQIIQPELMQMSAIATAALTKVDSASAGPAQSPQAPPQS